MVTTAAIQDPTVARVTSVGWLVPRRDGGHRPAWFAFHRRQRSDGVIRSRDACGPPKPIVTLGFLRVFRPAMAPLLSIPRGGFEPPLEDPKLYGSPVHFAPRASRGEFPRNPRGQPRPFHSCPGSRRGQFPGQSCRNVAKAWDRAGPECKAVPVAWIDKARTAHRADRVPYEVALRGPVHAAGAPPSSRGLGRSVCPAAIVRGGR
jgi:hypothetical protein